jgi:hypothetical protein
MFLKNIASVDFDGLEIVREYDTYRNRLGEMMQGRKAFNPREAGYYLLHLIQPAFYRNDLSFIGDFLKFYSGKTSAPFDRITMLISDILAYYEVTDALAHAAPKAATENSSEFHKWEGLIESLMILRSSKDKLFNIFDVLLEDFIGLSNMYLYNIGKRKQNLDDSIRAFTAALDECGQSRSVYPANLGFIRHFWESYIERNLGRAYFLNGDVQRAQQFQDSGERKRIQIRSQLRANRVDYLANAIELEICLSRFDLNDVIETETLAASRTASLPEPASLHAARRKVEEDAKLLRALEAQADEVLRKFTDGEPRTGWRRFFRPSHDPERQALEGRGDPGARKRAGRDAARRSEYCTEDRSTVSAHSTNRRMPSARYVSAGGTPVQTFISQWETR